MAKIDPMHDARFANLVADCKHLLADAILQGGLNCAATEMAKMLMYAQKPVELPKTDDRKPAKTTRHH